MILQKATIVKWRAVFRKENRSFSYVNQIDISSGWVWMFSFEHPLYLQSRPQWSRVENKLLLEPRWWPVASCTRWATCKCRSDNPWEVRRSKRDLFDWPPTSRSASGRARRMLVSKEAQRTRVAKWATRRGQRWDMAALIRYKLYPT